MLTIADYLGIKSSASLKDINDAYRKKSRTMHPDKAKQSFIAARAADLSKPKPGQKPTTHVNKPPSQREIATFLKEAGERFTRLGLIANILRGPDRDRYDHFLSNGFPTWRGTGYYYARFRPGLFTTLFALFLVGGGAVHYYIIVATHKQQRGYIERMIADARKKAWGSESAAAGTPGIDMAGTMVAAPVTQSPADAETNVPQPKNRREKRLQEKMQEKEAKKSKSKPSRKSGTSTPAEVETPAPITGPRRRVQATNGKILVVDSSGQVFLEEENEEGESKEFLLDPTEIPEPSFRQTMVVRAPLWAFKRLKALVLRET